jgi:hypothetical protein
MARMSRGMAILIALDQLLNALCAGWPDETLSSRAYRCGFLDATPKKRWRLVLWAIDRAFFWQPEHCKASYESEQNGRHRDKVFAPLEAQS